MPTGFLFGLHVPAAPGEAERSSLQGICRVSRFIEAWTRGFLQAPGKALDPLPNAPRRWHTSSVWGKRRASIGETSLKSRL